MTLADVSIDDLAKSEDFQTNIANVIVESGVKKVIDEDAQVCQSFLNDYILDEANRIFKINDY